MYDNDDDDDEEKQGKMTSLKLEDKARQC